MNDEHDPSSSSSATPVVAATALATIVLATAIWRRHSTHRDSQRLESQKLHVEEEGRRTRVGVVHRLTKSNVTGLPNVSNTAAMETDGMSKSSRSKERRRRGKDPIKELLKGGKKAKEISKLINSIHLEPSSSHALDSSVAESSSNPRSQSSASRTEDDQEYHRDDETHISGETSSPKEHEDAPSGTGTALPAKVGPSNRFNPTSTTSGDTIPSFTTSTTSVKLSTQEDSLHHSIQNQSSNIPTLSLQPSISLPATSGAETSSGLSQDYPSPKFNPTEKAPHFRSTSRGPASTGTPQTGDAGSKDRMSSSVSMPASTTHRIVPGSEAWLNSNANGDAGVDSLGDQHAIEAQKVNGKSTEPLPSGSSLKRGRKRNKSPSMATGGTSKQASTSSSAETESGTAQPSTPVSAQTQLASLRGALEAARIREEKTREEIDTLKRESEQARKREFDVMSSWFCHAYMQYLTQQLHSYASMFVTMQARQGTQQPYPHMVPNQPPNQATAHTGHYGLHTVHSPSGSFSAPGSSGSGSAPGSGANTNAHSSPGLFSGSLPFNPLSRSNTPSSLGAPPISVVQSESSLSDTSASSLPTPTPLSSLPSPPPSETASNPNSVSSPDAPPTLLPPASQIYSTPHPGGAGSGLTIVPPHMGNPPPHIPPPGDPMAFANSPPFASHFSFPPYPYPVSPYHQPHFAGSPLSPMANSPSMLPSPFFGQGYNGSFVPPQRPPSAGHFSLPPTSFPQFGQGNKSKSRSKNGKKQSSRAKERLADSKDKIAESTSPLDMSGSTSPPDSPSLGKNSIVDGEQDATSSTAASTSSTPSTPSSPSSSSSRSQSRRLPKDVGMTNMSSGLPPSPLEMIGLGFGFGGRDQERGRKQSVQGRGSVSSSSVSASSSSSLASPESLGMGDGWAALGAYGMYGTSSNSYSGQGSGYPYLGEEDGEQETDALYKTSPGGYGFGSGYAREGDSDDGTNGAYSDMLADAILKRPETMRMGSALRKRQSADDVRPDADKENDGGVQPEDGHSEAVVEFTFPSLSTFGNVQSKLLAKSDQIEAADVWVEKAPSSPPPTPPVSADVVADTRDDSQSELPGHS
ncbi:hypothetical protein VNI00_009695 [Paramarasmius palmivorus]|uniref:Uncharacterized protein n=1 Tax=Paramarasmius palmivorus TaxID=297713 RepID=A0AAW0CRC5_9AGAR